MKTLSEFPAPQGKPEDAKPDWYVGPFGLTPNSKLPEQDRFFALLDLLDHVDPYGGTWEIVRFSVWGEVEYLDQVFAKPQSKACQILAACYKESQ